MFHVRTNLWVLLVISASAWVPGALAQENSTVTSPDPSGEEVVVSDAVQQLEEQRSAVEAKKEEIATLDQKIQELRAKRDTTQAEAALIAHQLQRLQAQLRRAQLELQQTQLTMHVVRQEKQSTESAIEALQQERADRRQHLRAVIRQLYDHEQQSFVRMLLDMESLGAVLTQRAVYQQLQDQQVVLLQELKEKETALGIKQKELVVQQDDLSELQTLLHSQQQEILGDQQEQARFLQAKREQQVQYDHKLAEAKAARQEIEQDIFTLKDAGIKLSLTQATDMAKFASKLTGVRAALLLGVLKIETSLGKNLGSGTFPGDMHPDSRDAFLRITKKLSLDPAAAPISARPKNYSGWGGAMGPGQFMPATWETIEPRVAALMQKPVANPYDLTDAFVATALYLADKGATARSGEYEAVNRYLAGPNWQRFTWYGDRVLAVAQEYEKEGL